MRQGPIDQAHIEKKLFLDKQKNSGGGGRIRPFEGRLKKTPESFRAPLVRDEKKFTSTHPKNADLGRRNLYQTHFDHFEWEIF